MRLSRVFPLDIYYSTESHVNSMYHMCMHAFTVALESSSLRRVKMKLTPEDRSDLGVHEERETGMPWLSISILLPAAALPTASQEKEVPAVF